MNNPNSLLTAGQIQMRVLPEPRELAAYLDEKISSLAAAGCWLILLPEMFCCPYEAVNFPKYAQPEGGDIWQLCSGLAAKHQIWLQAGTMPELDPETGNVFNTAYVFDPQGRQAAKHRKMHLFDIDIKGGQQFKESDTLTAGNQVTVFDLDGIRCGLCICYDMRFPELGRLMALKGAQLILIPAAFNTTTGPKHWELCLRAQAMFNQCFVAATSSCLEPDSSYHAWGHSLVADPWGAVVNTLDETEGVQITTIDLTLTETVRQQLPLLQHRRTDVYTLAEV